MSHKTKYSDVSTLFRVILSERNKNNAPNPGVRTRVIHTNCKTERRIGPISTCFDCFCFSHYFNSEHHLTVKGFLNLSFKSFFLYDFYVPASSDWNRTYVLTPGALFLLHSLKMTRKRVETSGYFVFM